MEFLFSGFNLGDNLWCLDSDFLLQQLFLISDIDIDKKLQIFNPKPDTSSSQSVKNIFFLQIFKEGKLLELNVDTLETKTKYKMTIQW